MADHAPAPVIEEIAVRRTGPGTYENAKRLYRPIFARGVYGGQILGQACMAACAESVSPTLALHSIHCHYINGAIENHSVTYTVTILRDSSSFATREVKATQLGKLIFTMTASFHKPDNEPKVTYSGRKLPSSHPSVESMTPNVNIGNRVFAGWHPDDRASERPMEWVTSEDDLGYLVRHYGKKRGDEGYIEGEKKVLRQWARCKGDMEKESDWVHAISMAYVGDTFSCMFVPIIHGFDNLEWMVSLDFTIYFHKRNIRADKWWAVENTSPWAADGRGVLAMKVWDHEGDLCCTMIQEGLYRGPAPKKEGGSKL